VAEALVRWRFNRSRVKRHELELLPEATADHRIVAVETHGNCLPISNLLVDKIGN